MSNITLRFEEYQEIRACLTIGRVTVENHVGGSQRPYLIRKLQAASDMLEVARWRTEDEFFAARNRSVRWRARQAVRWVKAHRPTW